MKLLVIKRTPAHVSTTLSTDERQQANLAPAHPVSTSLAFPGNGSGDNQHDENEPPHGIIDLTGASSDEVSTWSQIGTISS